MLIRNSGQPDNGAAPISGIEEGIEEMLTVKHVGSRLETVFEAETFEVKENEGLHAFIASRGDGKIEIWLGHDLTGKNVACANMCQIFVMNGSGSTVGRYVYQPSQDRREEESGEPATLAA